MTSSWRDQAACFGHDPEWWFSDGRKQAQAAAAVCACCPVAGPCGQFADDHRIHFGIWGGQDRDMDRQRRTRWQRERRRRRAA